MMDMLPPASPADTAAPQGTELPPGVEVKQIDEAAIVRFAEEWFEKKKQDRRPYEQQWYLDAAALDGKPRARMQPVTETPVLEKTPPHREYATVNRIWTKHSAKVAKMLNGRPRPIVDAASQDREDVLDARYSAQWMKYIFRKADLESKYELAVANAEITGKAFWWIRWNPDALGRVQDPQDGQAYDVPLGDAQVDYGSAFSILVDDIGLELIGKQKRIMRVEAEPLTSIQKRYAEQLRGKEIKADASEADIFQFQRQIANLGSRWASTMPFAGKGSDSKNAEAKDLVLRKEMFEAPSAEYPYGRYILIAGGVLLRYHESLPYGFQDIESNPFPVVEFAAGLTPGRFWPQVQITRLRGISEQYDDLRGKLIEHLKLNTHGKLLIPRNAKIPSNAWNSEAGEKIYYNYIPGMPLPQVIYPAAINSDTWRMLEILREEFDAVPNIYPASLGAAGNAESGYQTNLLQEAGDAIYGPDKQRNARALTDAFFKLRRLAKQGYTQDRLISVTSKSNIPSVFAFSQENIDEHATITVEIGTALPDTKAARLQAVMELKGSGLLGDQNSPQAARIGRQLVDLGGIEEEIDPTYRDEERARLENLSASQGKQLNPPAPWDTHQVHVEWHFDQLRSPDFDGWPEPAKLQLIQHTVLHLQKFNPEMALEIASTFPIDPAITASLQQQMAAMQAPQPGAPGQPPTQEAPPGPPAEAAPIAA